MGITIDDTELRIDGKLRNKVLKRYKDDDETSYFDSFENGYYPWFNEENRKKFRYSDKHIIECVMKDFPDSDIFFRIVTDYGESAYSAKNGKIRELKKEWK